MIPVTIEYFVVWGRTFFKFEFIQMSKKWTTTKHLKLTDLVQFWIRKHTKRSWFKESHPAQEKNKNLSIKHILGIQKWWRQVKRLSFFTWLSFQKYEEFINFRFRKDLNGKISLTQSKYPMILIVTRENHFRKITLKSHWCRSFINLLSRVNKLQNAFLRFGKFPTKRRMSRNNTHNGYIYLYKRKANRYVWQIYGYHLAF